jgi:lysophospholipid acyltransferase
MFSDYGGYNLGINTSFMVQCTHLCSFAWDFTDALIPEAKRTPDQKKYAIKDVPSIAEFFAAALSPSQSIAGPSGNYNDFINFINLTGDFSNIPSTVMPCLIRFGTGIFWAIVYILINSQFPVVGTLGHPDFIQHNFFKKLFYLAITAVGLRGRYYCAWLVIESSIISSGQGYNGIDEKTKKPKFDRIYQIEILGCEFGIFAVAIAEVWNHGAHMWLKRYVYFRLNAVLNRDLSLYLTYVISAFWHGFYPMYLYGFLFYAITIETHKELYKLYYKYSFMRSFLARFVL